MGAPLESRAEGRKPPPPKPAAARVCCWAAPASCVAVLWLRMTSAPPACSAPLPRSHVLEVINDPKPPVRAAAIEALGRAITGALGALPPAAPPAAAAAASGGEGGAAAVAAAESTGGVEHMLLVALEALHNGDKERDVRAGVLRVLLNVLQVLRWPAQGHGSGSLCSHRSAVQQPGRHHKPPPSAAHPVPTLYAHPRPRLPAASATASGCPTAGPLCSACWRRCLPAARRTPWGWPSSRCS